MSFHLLNRWVYFTIIFAVSGVSWSATSTFSITPMPGTTLPMSILHGQTAMAYYTIHNDTLSPQKYHHIQLPPNVSQVVAGAVYHNNCTDNFEFPAKNNAPPNSECILQLAITGSVDSNDPDITHHLAICKNDAGCSFVIDKKDELNVIEGKANDMARLSIVNEYAGSPYNTSRQTVAYTSPDGGVSWKKNEILGVKGSIRAVNCDASSNQFCTAVGEVYGGVNGNKATLMAYSTQNGGVTWKAQSLDDVCGVPSGLESVSCKDNYCAAVGSYTSPSGGTMVPIVYLSTDQGDSWTTIYPKPLKTFPFFSSLRAVSCSGYNGQYCTAVGDLHESSKVTTFIAYNSNDNGVSWTSQIIGKHEGISLLKAVFCNKENGQNCIAVGYTAPYNGMPMKAIIYRSTNGGADWTSYIPEETLSGALNSITCTNNFCLAVGSIGENDNNNHPVLYLSLDGGESWTTHNFTISAQNANKAHFSPKGGAFNSVTCSNEGKNCTILGHVNYTVSKFYDSYNKNIVFPIVLRSIDSGVTWHHRWPDFFNEDDLLKAISTTGISMAGSN